MEHDVVVILVALAFHMFDMLSGIVGALRSEEKLNSSKLRDGLFKKVGFIFCYMLAWLIQYASVYVDLPIKIPLLVPIVVYAVLTEIVSIIENISVINPDLTPQVLKRLIGLDKEN